MYKPMSGKFKPARCHDLACAMATSESQVTPKSDSFQHCLITVHSTCNPANRVQNKY